MLMYTINLAQSPTKRDSKKKYLPNTEPSPVRWITKQILYNAPVGRPKNSGTWSHAGDQCVDYAHIENKTTTVMNN